MTLLLLRVQVGRAFLRPLAFSSPLPSRPQVCSSATARLLHLLLLLLPGTKLVSQKSLEPEPEPEMEMEMQPEAPPLHDRLPLDYQRLHHPLHLDAPVLSSLWLVPSVLLHRVD